MSRNSSPDSTMGGDEAAPARGQGPLCLTGTSSASFMKTHNTDRNTCSFSCTRPHPAGAGGSHPFQELEGGKNPPWGCGERQEVHEAFWGNPRGSPHDVPHPSQPCCPLPRAQNQQQEPLTAGMLMGALVTPARGTAPAAPKTNTSTPVGCSRGMEAPTWDGDPPTRAGGIHTKTSTPQNPYLHPKQSSIEP